MWLTHMTVPHWYSGTMASSLLCTDCAPSLHHPCPLAHCWWSHFHHNHMSALKSYPILIIINLAPSVMLLLWFGFRWLLALPALQPGLYSKASCLWDALPERLQPWIPLAGGSCHYSHNKGDAFNFTFSHRQITGGKNPLVPGNSATHSWRSIQLQFTRNNR